MNSCSICQLPVLELDGQFENLQPYDGDTEHPAMELAGECHSSCISTHEYGRTWHDWRVRSYSSGRGYRVAGEPEDWCVLVHPRHPGLLAFHASGFSVARGAPTPRESVAVVDNGILVSVNQEFNLALSDIEIVDELKAGLRSDGKYSILTMLNKLGVADRIKWPQALTSADFVLDKKLQGHWMSAAVSMRARYNQFLPSQIVSFWKSLR